MKIRMYSLGWARPPRPRRAAPRRPGLRDKFEERAAADAPSGRPRLEKRCSSSWTRSRQRARCGFARRQPSCHSAYVSFFFSHKDREDVYSEGERLMKDRRFRKRETEKERRGKRRERDARNENGCGATTCSPGLPDRLLHANSSIGSKSIFRRTEGTSRGCNSPLSYGRSKSRPASEK